VNQTWDVHVWRSTAKNREQTQVGGIVFINIGGCN
jgi:hypothetical protein